MYQPYKYDPNNPLSEEELQFTKPLSSYHTKRFASLSLAQQGKQITDEELKKAEKIGKDNEKKIINKIKNK